MKKVGWILFALIAAYFIFIIRQDIIDNQKLREERQRVMVKLEQEEKLAQELQNRLELLKQSDYLEGLARTKLGLVKKGEKAYKVIGR